MHPSVHIIWVIGLALVIYNQVEKAASQGWFESADISLPSITNSELEVRNAFSLIRDEMNAGKYNVPTQISHVPQVTLDLVSCAVRASNPNCDLHIEQRV